MRESNPMLTGRVIFVLLLSSSFSHFFLHFVQLSVSLLGQSASSQIFHLLRPKPIHLDTKCDIMPEPIKRGGGKEWTFSSISWKSSVSGSILSLSLWQTTHGTTLILFHRGLAWWLLATRVLKYSLEGHPFVRLFIVTNPQPCFVTLWDNHHPFGWMVDILYSKSEWYRRIIYDLGNIFKIFYIFQLLIYMYFFPEHFTNPNLRTVINEELQERQKKAKESLLLKHFWQFLIFRDLLLQIFLVFLRSVHRSLSWHNLHNLKLPPWDRPCYSPFSLYFKRLEILVFVGFYCLAYLAAWLTANGMWVLLVTVDII